MICGKALVHPVDVKPSAKRKFIFKRILSVGVLGLMALACPGFSAVNSVGSLANPLENAGVSARALSMGWAFVGVADDSSALFWNPAGLGDLKNMELALHHNSWLAGIIQEAAVVALPMGNLGGIGISYNYINYGTLSGYDSAANQISDYTPIHYGFNLGWGKTFLKDFSAGVALKGSMLTGADTSYSDFSMDLGTLWCPARNLRLGAAYTNLGTTVAGYAQAADLSLGGSYRFDFFEGNHLLIAASGVFEPQGVNRLRVGVEDVIYSFLALRVGYQANLADNQIQDLIGLTAGIGVMFEGFSLDYAYLPYGDLDTAHRISLSYKFGQGKKVPGYIFRGTKKSDTAQGPVVASNAEAKKTMAIRYLIYGNVLYKQGNAVKAEVAYRQATVLDPDSANSWKGLGNALTQLNRPSEAIVAYRRSLKLNPSDQVLQDYLKKVSATANENTPRGK